VAAFLLSFAAFSNEKGHIAIIHRFAVVRRALAEQDMWAKLLMEKALFSPGVQMRWG
jgi:hypothetical protein